MHQRAIFLTLALLSACNRTEAPSPPPTTPVASAAAAQAKAMYDNRCATCHGATGRGNGPAAMALSPRPRDMTQKTWQEAMTDEAITKIIVEGGPAAGKSVLMPANPDLRTKPEVLRELVALVRNFGK